MVPPSTGTATSRCSAGAGPLGMTRNPPFRAMAAEVARRSAMVAAAGRVDARAWDASTTPPVPSPSAPRKTPVALLVALALFVAVAAFLLGLAASSRSPEPTPTPAPAVR